MEKGICDALKASELEPIHVSYENVSTWYYLRQRMAPKRHISLKVKQNEVSLLWEACIYTLKPRDEDLEIIPTKKYVIPPQKSRWLAYKAGVNACDDRDTMYRMRDIPTCSYLKLLVVSEIFVGMENIDRLVAIYDIIFRRFGLKATMNGGSTFADYRRCAPKYSRLASLHGENVCGLPVFRVFGVSEQPLNLIVAAKTPAQWKPEAFSAANISDRIGPTHAQLRSTELTPAARPRAIRNRIKRLCLSKDADSRNQRAGQNALAGSRNDDFLPPIEQLGRGSQLRACTAPTKETAATLSSSSSRLGSGHLPRLRASMRGKAAVSVYVSDIDNTDAGDEFDDSEAASLASSRAYRADACALRVTAAPSSSTLHNGWGRDSSHPALSHFFRDLNPQVKELVLIRLRENKKLIQREGNVVAHRIEEARRKKQQDDYLSLSMPLMEIDGQGGSAGKHVKAAVLSFDVSKEDYCDYDSGAKSEEEMLEEVMIAALLVERVAVRLQRIRRLKMFTRAAKLWWQRQYAAIVLQKVVRGRLSRLYFCLMRRLYPHSAKKIQDRFRSHRSRYFLSQWMKLTRRLTRVVLPKIKRFILNIAIRLTFRLTRCAIKIQAIVRMRNCRVRYIKQRWRIFARVKFAQCALMLQRYWRGFLGRRKASAIIEDTLVQRIDAAACQRLQRCWRGFLGRRRVAHLRLQHAMARRVQKLVRAFVRRLWYRQMKRALLEADCAIEIQRMVRGMLDKERANRWAARRHFVQVYIPAVIKVQAQIRRFVVAKFVRYLCGKLSAADRIKRSYRRFIRRMRLLALMRQRELNLKHRMATRIQQVARRYLCMTTYRRRQLVLHGQITRAARLIMHAWLSFKKVIRLREEIENVKLDLHGVYKDIEKAEQSLSRTKQRVRELQTFCVEVDLRLPSVEAEIAHLTAEDIDRGWGQALTQEFEQLNYQSLLAREEIRLQKFTQRKRTEEIMMLKLELDDLYLDLDQFGVMEIDASEALRRAEVTKVERKVKDHFKRKVRLERTRWRIDSNRAHVIRRTRFEQQKLRHEHYHSKASKEMRPVGYENFNVPPRGIEYAATLSFEKRQQQREFEMFAAHREKAKMEEYYGNGKVDTYEVYAGPIQKTYDTVVADLLEQLRSHAQDERVHRMRKEEEDAQKSKKKSSLGQFSSLKDDFEELKRQLGSLGTAAR